MKKEEFLEAINTLKLYRRAELVDAEGERLIKELYVDPLPGNHVLETILRPNTTFLIGRKGTGKSTIFQRAQESLNSNKHVTWAYIDIKTLFESSTSELLGITPLDPEVALSLEAIQKLNIFKKFIIELVQEIRKQIQERVTSSVWSAFRSIFRGSTSELFEKLDEFIQELEQDQYLDVTGSVRATTHEEISRIRYEVRTKTGQKESLCRSVCKIRCNSRRPS